MTKRFYFQGIQAKTFFIFFFVFITIIVPVNLVIYAKVKGILARADANELHAEAERLFSVVRFDPPYIPLPAAGYAMKVQQNNELLFEEVFTSPDFPELEPFQYFEEESEADTFRIVTLRKVTGASGNLFFSLARSNQRLQQQLIDLKFYLFAANAASIIIAGIVVFIATGITLRPIKRIITVADRINVSRSIERVPVPDSKDENQLLAETINAMLARMEQTIQNQTNFFASATHELKTPLAVMQAELSLALQNETSREINKILKSCLVETQRLDHVIQDFLLISQLRSDSLILRKQRIEMDEVFYSSFKKMKYMMQELEKSVQVTVSDKPLWIDADEDKLETVIGNLVENAIKYSVAGEMIHVTMKRENERILFIVENHVAGPVAAIDQLKEEFKKSEQLSSGLGMGLWICDKIIALHKANLHLSQREDLFVATIVFDAVG